MKFIKNKKVNSVLVAICLASMTTSAFAQNNGHPPAGSITTAAPFLTLGPDARAGGMGDSGGATEADVYSMQWNAAKYAFTENKFSVAANYSPWMKSIGVDGVGMSSVVGYYKIDDRQTIASSFKYFSMGEMIMTDQGGNQISTTNPNEFSIDVAYIRKLSDVFSMAMTARYIYSNQGTGTVDGVEYEPGSAFAMDVAAFYQQDISDKWQVRAGANFSNMGTKMNYGNYEQFLPANMRLSGGATYFIDDKNKVSFNLDINKLMAPTNPEYDENGNIIAGKDPNRSAMGGMFGSFADAPGGFSEELQEFYFATGIEYGFRDMLFARGGYYYENPNKGGRQYGTVGFGIKYNDIQLDMSYLIAGDDVNGQDPMANSLRFGLVFNFGSEDQY